MSGIGALHIKPLGFFTPEFIADEFATGSNRHRCCRSTGSPSMTVQADYA
jgi:hypothetical protein